ncbi:alpha/beta fold hydrolase [Kutzneria sp. NPDC052558]|uniref:alpha/beta fold hydrolase n=1 Tax=Kutzneria sp. NPDC052558 TaxID=3364121 RepID=UPI0037C5B52B
MDPGPGGDRGHTATTPTERSWRLLAVGAGYRRCVTGLAYDVAGVGPAVVLLHSSVGDRRMWDPQWGLLVDAGYRVVRCDFRGHGQSPAPAEPFNAAEDVRTLLDSLGVGKAAIVGASYGGRVAQEIAARWPERVSELILLCAATRLHPPTAAIMEFSAREEELLAAGDIAGAAELNVATLLGPAASAATREVVMRMQRLTFEIQLAAGDAAQSRESAFVRNADFDLSAVTARTVVVSGDHDVDYFRSTADQLAASIPGAVRVRLPWAGHLPTLEAPATMNPLILNWLGPSPS